MRRRIYDAWNVLKAASIIVPRDRSEKYFMYNQQLVVEEALEYEQAQANVGAENQSIQEEVDEENPSQCKNSEEERKDTDKRVAGKTNAELAVEIEEHVKECQSTTDKVQAKFYMIRELVKSQLELKRLIKRN